MQSGATNLLVIPLVLVTVLLLGVGIVAFSLSGQATDAKTNLDQKISVAVEKAKQDTSLQKDKDFAEKEKFPYNRYDGPSSFGGLRVLYPKSWSAYVSEARGNSSKPVDGYFAPGHVPSVDDTNSIFALRITVEQRTYDSVLKDYQGRVKQGTLSSRPYQSPNVPNLVGSRLDGEVVSKKQGAMIVMPLRDKTLEMWTESKDYVADFDNIILPNFSFTP
jgi:hypothetical protein